MKGKAEKGQNVEKEIFVTVPMIMDMELAVSKTAEALARFMNFSPDQADEMKHAVIEACINAIEHSSSPDRKIYLTFKLFSGRMEIRVTDHGQGFNPSAVEKPDIRKKMVSGSRKRGWGLTLMKNLMDDVRIESGVPGTTIIMIKKVQPVTENGYA